MASQISAERLEEVRGYLNTPWGDPMAMRLVGIGLELLDEIAVLIDGSIAMIEATVRIQELEALVKKQQKVIEAAREVENMGFYVGSYDSEMLKLFYRKVAALEGALAALEGSPRCQ